MSTHMEQLTGLARHYLATPPGGWPETQQAWHQLADHANWGEHALSEWVDELAAEHPDWLHPSRTAPVHPRRIRELLTELNRYQGDDIWGDVIIRLPEYDAHATRQIDDSTRFALRDGTVITYDRRVQADGPGVPAEAIAQVPRVATWHIETSQRMRGIVGSA